MKNGVRGYRVAAILIFLALLVCPGSGASARADAGSPVCPSLNDPYRTAKDFVERWREIKTVIILPPRIDMFQVQAGGVRQKIDSWSTAAADNAVSSLESVLAPTAQMRQLPLEKLSPEVAENLRETQALFDAVNGSIILHTYPSPFGPSPNLFPEKVENFDYSLGLEVRNLSETGDAFLLIRGQQQRTTVGRKAVLATAAILGAVVGVITTGSSGIPTFLSAALVDAKTGDVLWHSVKRFDHYDLRERTEVDEAIRDLVSTLPARGEAPH